MLIDYVTLHIHASGQAEGPQSRLSHTTKLALGFALMMVLDVVMG